ncbi:hypothetical protein ACFXJ8_35780 [Nonomuraea sp. NPDC059194]|uniref:hypothetical protein n=1 Tax=Nonomuraea sp. NPDC059194 TaxID=3346764 RepID=UPI0036BFB3C3
MIFDRVRTLGMNGQVTVSHAFTLATSAPDQIMALIGEAAELDIAFTTIAPSGHLRRILTAKWA